MGAVEDFDHQTDSLNRYRSLQIKGGKNEIEVVVTNTLENMLGDPIESGIIGDVRIVPYNFIIDGIGKGSEVRSWITGKEY